MKDEEKPPWERLSGESCKAYKHFCIYRDMGPERSLSRMASVPECTSIRRQLNRWSSKWHWVERCQIYDDAQERIARRQQERARLEMNKRHAKIGVLGQNIAVEGLKTLLNKIQTGEQAATPAELTRLLDTSTKVERLARGELPDNQNSVKGGGGHVQLNEESIEQKAREAVEEYLGIADRGAAK